MKKQVCVAALALFVSVQVATAVPEKAPLPLKPVAAQVQAALLSARVLARYHYKATPLDDAMSEKIFDRYFKSLDGDKLYFTAHDLDQFEPVRDKLDDAINNENLTIPFAVYGVYQQRVLERFAYSRELLKQNFDFTVAESYYYDREKANWAKNDDELNELWRKRVKNEWLRLKLAGKDDKAIRETLDKRYEGAATRFKKLDGEDVFQIFMNAYAMSIEPHTNYLGPRAAESFDIAMRLSLEGIGASLQTRDDYTVIRELVVGSPAAMSGKLKVGDRIVGVGQGEHGGLTEVLGWRLDEVVPLVRGAKDSVVRLSILPVDAGADARPVLVQLVRKKINMEDQSAKKSIIEVKDGALTRRVGVIALPTFYQDFEARGRSDKDYKSATRDVARLLAELKKDKVDNVLIDLRNNGGGSLVEAIELTGLFIDKGPVVQHRNAEGKIEVENDKSGGVAWDGPVGVLINRGSASASEIFAAALQDYGRGLIIGEPSFGKGTVQTLVSLNRFAQSDKMRLGELKMTMAQFFRITGGTTQLRGVVPDIKLPVTSDPENSGESSYDNALPWTQIKSAAYVPVGDLKDVVAPLQRRHEARVAKDREFQYLVEDLAEFHKLRKESVISLNEAVRRKERDAQEARAKLREGRNAAKSASRRDDGLQAGERNLASELAAEKAAKNAKDVFLTEAAHILSDEVSLLRTDTRLAQRVMPYAPPTRGGGN